MYLYLKGQEKYIKPTKSQCQIMFNGENDDESYVDMISYLIKKKAKQIF